MKRFGLFFNCLLLFLSIAVTSFCVEATPPLPSPFVEKTTIAGLVLLDEEEVVASNVSFSLDFKKPTSIGVSRIIEKEALLTINYDFSYSQEAKVIRFFLPLLNKLRYVDEKTRILVDGQEVAPRLNVSPDIKYFSDQDEIPEASLGFAEKYYESMIVETGFFDEIKGYHYIVKNPKTRSSQYYAHTTLSFHDVSPDVVLVDINKTNQMNQLTFSTSKIYKSEEEFEFFSTSEVAFTAESTEVKLTNSVYEGHNKLLEEPTIHITPMRLKEYLSTRNPKQHHFKDVQTKVYDYELEKMWRDEYFNNFSSERLAQTTLDNYYAMSLEFDVDFSKADRQVQIQMPIPVHCHYNNMVLKVISNPAQTLQGLEYFTFKVAIDEKLISSTHPTSKKTSTFCWVVEDEASEVVFENTSVKNAGRWGFILIAIVMVFFRPVLYLTKSIAQYGLIILFALAIVIVITRMKRKNK